MKCVNITTKTFIISIVVLLTPITTPAMDFSDKEIFTWVAGELNIQKQYKMPAIQYVTKEKLGKVFRKNNERSFKRWAREYGEEEASKLIKFYLSEVIGLYVPKTGDLYVGDFIEPCKKEAIVAHELTHFFQHMENGPLDPNARDAANKHLYNEMQGGHIEKKFIKEFCETASVGSPPVP